MRLGEMLLVASSATAFISFGIFVIRLCRDLVMDMRRGP
jgi:hypothetical protein